MKQLRIPRRFWIVAAFLGGAVLGGTAGVSAAPPHNPTDAEIAARLHPPLTLDAPDTTPRPYSFVEPAPLALPSQQELNTVTVKDRAFEITRVSKQSDGTNSKNAADKQKLATEGLALYQADDEALFFRGTGGGGLKSKERLIVENCTFTLDFGGNVSSWEPRRAAIYVDGYKEVLIRNCVFISKAKKGDPERKVTASIYAVDCLKVQIEDCYFEGLTSWFRGHITLLSCGPTSIRRCEVAGQRQGSSLLCGGGIWVANGIGESKLGTPVHADQPELMIYPSGPLLIEDCYVHDQKGTLNTDGIYVQSIHPFLIRNTRVENWGDDSLIDVGFRDSAKGRYKGQPLANHGAIGVVENCEFSNGYIKDSVGAGGGVIFRNNLLKNAWFFPYVFDGGSWYVVGNRILDLTGPLISGYNYGTSGWVPPEGMLIGGSKYFFYGNLLQSRAAISLPALFVSTPIAASTLAGNVVADYNFYALPQAPLVWADDRAAKRRDTTLADWQKATGNDLHSLQGDAGALPQWPQTTVKLPGGVAPSVASPIGLIGPVGPTPAILARAKTLSAQVEAQLPPPDDSRFEFEDFLVLDKQGNNVVSPDEGASGGKYRLWTAQEGDALTYGLTIFRAGRYTPTIRFFNQSNLGQLQFQLDGKTIGAPVAIDAQGARFDAIELSAGDHRLTLKLIGIGREKTNVRFDALELTPQ